MNYDEYVEIVFLTFVFDVSVQAAQTDQQALKTGQFLAKQWPSPSGRTWDGQMKSSASHRHALLGIA